jgi:hypothetical protein
MLEIIVTHHVRLSDADVAAKNVTRLAQHVCLELTNFVIFAMTGTAKSVHPMQPILAQLIMA